MSEHFGVGMGAKIRIAAADEFIFQRLIIFDYAIVNQRQPTAGVEVRMRIFVVYFAMRGPARMADAQRAGYRLFPDEFCERRDASRTFPRIQFTSIDDSQ